MYIVNWDKLDENVKTVILDAYNSLFNRGSIIIDLPITALDQLLALYCKNNKVAKPFFKSIYIEDNGLKVFIDQESTYPSPLNLRLGSMVKGKYSLILAMQLPLNQNKWELKFDDFKNILDFPDSYKSTTLLNRFSDAMNDFKDKNIIKSWSYDVKKARKKGSPIESIIIKYALNKDMLLEFEGQTTIDDFLSEEPFFNKATTKQKKKDKIYTKYDWFYNRLTNLVADKQEPPFYLVNATHKGYEERLFIPDGRKSLWFTLSDKSSKELAILKDRQTLIDDKLTIRFVGKEFKPAGTDTLEISTYTQLVLNGYNVSYQFKANTIKVYLKWIGEYPDQLIICLYDE